MKTVVRFLFLAACISLLTACDKSDPFTDDLSGTDLKKATKTCPEIVVEPETGFDTENLVAAFNEAKSLGPGTTIRLTEGTYTIGMIEVHDFDGVLTGAGQGKTIINSLPNLPCEEYWEMNQLPALMTFLGGNVVVSNMTFQMNDGELCARGEIQDQIYGELGAIIVMADYSELYIPENRYFKGVLDKVDFFAGYDGGYGVYGSPGNVEMLVYIGTPLWTPGDFFPLSSGEITMKKCKFKDGLTGPDIFGLDENSLIRLEGNIYEKNACQIFIAGCSGSSGSIINNQFSDATPSGLFGAASNDLYIEGGDWGYYPDLFPAYETRYTISGNNFKSPPGGMSLYISDTYRLKDPDVVVPQSFFVKGNVFNNGDGGMAILSLNTKNAKIWNNKFLGSGNMGVELNGDEATGIYSEGNQITGNNFFGAAYTDATVHLGPFTRNNKVVGVSSDKVVDEGTNNLIIGTKAKKHGVPPHSSHFNKFKPFR
jgi:hypothetical protein